MPHSSSPERNEDTLCVGDVISSNKFCPGIEREPNLFEVGPTYDDFTEERGRSFFVVESIVRENVGNGVGTSKSTRVHARKVEVDLDDIPLVGAEIRLGDYRIYFQMSEISCYRIPAVHLHHECRVAYFIATS